MERHEFVGVIESAPRGGAFIEVPFDVEAAFGTRRSVRVRVRYDDLEADSSIAPMGGRHVLGVHKATRQALGKAAGDRVRISLVRDTRERTVELPPELARALAEDADLRARFEGLSHTHRKEFARSIATAKRPDTRERRLARALDGIRRGEKP